MTKLEKVMLEVLKAVQRKLPEDEAHLPSAWRELKALVEGTIAAAEKPPAKKEVKQAEETYVIEYRTHNGHEKVPFYGSIVNYSDGPRMTFSSFKPDAKRTARLTALHRKAVMAELGSGRDYSCSNPQSPYHFASKAFIPSGYICEEHSVVASHD